MGKYREGVGKCSNTALDELSRLLNPQMAVLGNGSTILIVMFAGILVGIGLYTPHYRHRSCLRYFFLGATTLYLPILSYVVANGSTFNATLSKPQGKAFLQMTSGSIEIMVFKCLADLHFFLILLWLGLAQIIGINTSTIVAADVREGRNNSVSVVVLAKAMWTWCLAADLLASDPSGIVLIVFLLVFAKVVLKCFAYWLASRSLSHGRNPRLIVGYMMQLNQRSQRGSPTFEHQVDGKSQEESQHVGLTDRQQADTTYEILLPPPLIVMGEERQNIEKTPQGYFIKYKPGQDDITVMSSSLVTIDKVWQLDDTLMGSMPRIKDLCFSFALFKLLRCRFAGYTVVEAGFTQAHKFFWHELVKDSNVERLFRMIEDELSFLHDYYYTSLPMSYLKSWLPTFSMLTSVFSIQYCLYIAYDAIVKVVTLVPPLGGSGQITCVISCFDSSAYSNNDDLPWDIIHIGSLLVDLVLVSFLLALVVLTEGKAIASYIFTNWKNVSLVCQYVENNDTMKRAPDMHRLVSVASELRYKLMGHRMDKINQCSILVLHPRYHPTVIFMRLLILLCLGDRSVTVRVPPVVKAAIIDTLRRNSGVKNSGEAFLPRIVQDGGNFIWGCSDKGAAHTILICHIATSLLELRCQQASIEKITATHLSRYCAYLVSHLPELLPDDEKWCKSLYKDVKKNSLHLLSCSASRYEVLVKLLNIQQAHEVLQKGASLSTQLVTEDGSIAWGVLAEFWTEMILQVASSGQPDKHAEAIAGGTELITLLWALVMQVGPGPTPAHTTVPEPKQSDSFGGSGGAGYPLNALPSTGFSSESDMQLTMSQN